MSRLRIPMTLFFSSLAAFFLLKWALGLGASCHVLYYPQLAWSFLHGRLDLVGVSADSLDLTPFHGRLYAYWPPLTAILMLPFVAILGPQEFPQRIFGLVFAAFNTALFYLIAERFLSNLGPRISHKSVLAFTLAYGLGTSNLLFGVIANHWWIGQLTAATFLLLSFWTGLDRDPKTRPLSNPLSFIFLAVACVGRQPLIFFTPLLLFLAWSDSAFQWHQESWSDRVKKGWWLLAPLMVVATFFLCYNHARFGMWMENGVRFSNQSAEFQPDFRRHGTVSIHYFLTNAYRTLLRLPGLQYFDHQGGLANGFSLFVQSPILLSAFLPTMDDAHASLRQALWISVILASLPGFLMLGGGYSQFGARYLFDEVPGLLLIALLNSKPSDLPWILFGTGLSIAVNFYRLCAVLGKFPF